MSEEGRKGVVKTSITLARDLWEEAQIMAIKSGLTFTEVVSTALKKYLEIIEEERAGRGRSGRKKVEKVQVE